MADILLDTSAIFALLNLEDTHHRKATAIHESMARRRVTLILPNFLLAESHRRCGSGYGRKAANSGNIHLRSTF